MIFWENKISRNLDLQRLNPALPPCIEVIGLTAHIICANQADVSLFPLLTGMGSESLLACPSMYEATLFPLVCQTIKSDRGGGAAAVPSFRKSGVTDSTSQSHANISGDWVNAPEVSRTATITSRWVSPLIFMVIIFICVAVTVPPLLPPSPANPARAEARALKVKWHFLLSPRLSYGGYTSKAAKVNAARLRCSQVAPEVVNRHRRVISFFIFNPHHHHRLFGLLLQRRSTKRWDASISSPGWSA